MKSLAETIHHRCASGDDYRLAEVIPQVDVTGLNTSVDHLVDTRVLETNKSRLEQNLWCLRFDIIVKLNVSSIRQDVFSCFTKYLYSSLSYLEFLLLLLQLFGNVYQLGVRRQFREELTAF